MKTLKIEQLTASNKLQLIKAIANYDFYNDFAQIMQDTKQEDVEMAWYFDIQKNEIRLETHQENSWAEYEHGYDHSYHIYGLSFAKGYQQNLFFAFASPLKNFEMLVSQGKFGRMVRSSDKDMVNLNMISWILQNITKKI